MNFLNLQYFLKAAEERNITRAARKLYISQQSLSGHIAKLEEELGVPLFERGAELKLTYAGERVELLARKICALEQEILQETDDSGTGAGAGCAWVSRTPAAGRSSPPSCRNSTGTIPWWNSAWWRGIICS